MKILVVRNDKLGDFMLAWPAFALLKHYLPEALISALVPAYTAPMAELCPWIDSILIDDKKASAATLARRLRAERFDAMLTLFSTGRVGIAGWLARIPYRLAPATKVAQLFYNHRQLQRRSRSEKPEYAYNLDLAYRLLADLGHLSSLQVTKEQDGDWLPSEITRPVFPPRHDQAALKEQFCVQHGLSTTQHLVFIHPGSGGSARNLSPAQYAALANNLRIANGSFVVTAGPGEERIAQEVAAQLHAPHTLFHSTGLGHFVEALQLADLFISGSTGPFHIAGALNRPTATFFPRHRSATPLRWQPLNHPAKRLAFTPPESALADDVAAIDLNLAAQQINRHFFN